MSRLYAVFFTVMLCAICARAADDSDAPPIAADETILTALPKIPTLAKIGTTPKEINAWVETLIKKKELKARIEIVQLKERIKQEQREAIAADKERIRREDRYNASFGGPLRGLAADGASAKRNQPIKVKLAFQVPELEMYTRLIDVYKQRSALAYDCVETLTRLDRNADGKLSSDEYRDAGNLYLATRKLFRSIDEDNDEMLSLTELESAHKLPANGAEAIPTGAAINEAANSPDPLKAFDKNGDGVLNLAEFKALSSAYLVAALNATHDVEHCQKVIDALTVAQQTSAAKFENLTIDVEAPE